jgi:bla regulator protein blaR1
MLNWMIYVLLVGSILSLAALLAEQAARLREQPTRWIWLGAMTASTLLPLIVSSFAIEVPNLFGPALPQTLIVLREAMSLHLPWSKDGWFGLVAARDAAIWDRRLIGFWSSATAVAALLLVFRWLWIAHCKRQWRRTSIDAVKLFVAPDRGPALVGGWHTSIVVPTWLMQAAPAQRDIVVAQGQAHLDARDPQWLGYARFLLVAMPWNAALWWQWLCLRKSIATDTGRGLLRGGVDRAAYLEALAEVQRHPSPHWLSERFMQMPKTCFSFDRSIPRSGFRVALLASWSLSVAVVAAQVAPPDSAATPSKATAADAIQLDQYAGYYRFNDHAAMAITRVGAQLLRSFGTGPRESLSAKAIDEFSSDREDVQIRFVRDAGGNVSGLVQQQWGYDKFAPRIDARSAHQIDQANAQKFASQTATPGSDAALRRLLDGLRQTPQNFDGASPEVAHSLAQHGADFAAMLAKHGAIVALKFVGPTEAGCDKYLVRYEHGAAVAAVLTDNDGMVTAWGFGP